MKFVINHIIVFTPSTRLLAVNDNEELAVTLSNQASRLLIELIGKAGVTLTRQELMKCVWEDFGYKASNHNLNGAISEVRKGLKTLNGDAKSIVTLPKVGFRFSAEIIPIFDEPPPELLPVESGGIEEEERESTTIHPGNTPADDSLNESPITADNNLSAAVSENKKSRFPGLIGYAIALLICIIALGAVWYISAPQKLLTRPISPIFLYKDNKCNVYSLDTRNYYSQQEMSEFAKNDMKSFNIDCVHTKNNVFYSRISSDDTIDYSVFIGTCSLSGNSGYTSCREFWKKY